MECMTFNSCFLHYDYSNISILEKEFLSHFKEKIFYNDLIDLDLTLQKYLKNGMEISDLKHNQIDLIDPYRDFSSDIRNSFFIKTLKYELEKNNFKISIKNSKKIYEDKFKY